MSSWHVDLRKPIRSKNQLLNPNQMKRKKKRKVKLAWDDTVKDLSVFKPSIQELQRNHELHRPKKDHERLIQRIQSAQAFMNDNDGDVSLDTTAGIVEKKRALLKEIFNKQERELREVISESGRTLANVKDIFGDHAQKFKGVPNITKAPQCADYSMLSALDPRIPSRYEILSNSVMVNPALNALSEEDEQEDESDVEKEEKGSNNTFQSKINMDRYQQLLQEHTNSLHAELPEKLKSKFLTDDFDLKNFTENNTIHNNEIPNVEHPKVGPSEIKTQDNDGANHAECTTNTSSLSKSISSTNPLQSFNDMKVMLDLLESEISEYEQESGKENVTAKIKIPSTLTGYTASLLTAVIRITRHLKESEVQLRAEMSMRKDILDALDEQRSLVDALTVDLLDTQEMNALLQQELQLQKKANQTQYASLKMDMTKLQQTVNQLLLGNRNIDTHEHFRQLQDITNSNRATQQPKNTILQQPAHHTKNNINDEKRTVSPLISPIHF